MVFVPFISENSWISRVQTRSSSCGYNHKESNGKINSSHEPVVFHLKKRDMYTNEIDYDLANNEDIGDYLPDTGSPGESVSGTIIVWWGNNRGSF